MTISKNDIGFVAGIASVFTVVIFANAFTRCIL